MDIRSTLTVVTRLTPYQAQGLRAWPGIPPEFGEAAQHGASPANAIASGKESMPDQGCIAEHWQFSNLF